MTTSSSLTKKSSALVRLRPDDLVRIVDEAVLLLESNTRGQVDEKLRPTRVYLASLIEVGDTESAEEVRAELAELEIQAEAMALPRWHISTRKDDRMESLNAAAGDVAPDLTIPRQQTYVSANVSAQGNSIEIRLGASGATITIQSSDAAWALRANLWATQAIASITPRYAWIVRPAAKWAFVLLGVVIAVAALFFPLTSGAISFVEALLIAAGGAGVGALVWLATLQSLQGTILSTTLWSRWREFAREGALILIGGIVGVVLSEVWRLINNG